jgi:hypothetical protein
MSTALVNVFIVRALSDSRRLIRPLVVGVVGGAVLLGSVASVAARPAGGHTLRVTWHNTSAVSTQVDPASTMAAAGDEFFGGFIVLRFASPHDEIGTAGIHCATTGAGGSEILCEAAFILPDGKITTQTLFDVQAELAGSAPRKLAITGGTGAYRGATGELTVTPINDTDEQGVFSFDR